MEGKDRLVYIYGVNPVIESFKVKGVIKEIYLSRKRQKKLNEIIELAEKNRVAIKFVDDSTLDKLVQGSNQGVVAKVKPKKTISLDEALDISNRKSEPALFLILDLIEDPQNLGSILRVADATGVHAVIYQERRSVGLVPSVWKASAGAVWHVNLVEVNNIKYAIKELRELGVRIIGTDAEANRVYWESDFKTPLAILLGSEGKGIRLKVRELCDEVVKIPMRGKVNSLNVSAACSVLLYETLRQRSLFT